MEPMDRPRAHPLDVLVAWSLAVIVALGVAGVALWRPLAGHAPATQNPPPAAALVASPTSMPRARIVATARVAASTTATARVVASATQTAAQTATPTPTLTPTAAAPATASPATATPTAVLTAAPIASPAAPTLVAADATASAPPSAATFVYVVRAGETLGVIAARYGTTIAMLAELNDLADPDVLAEGQELLIPTGP